MSIRTYFEDIADAIREASGSSDTYTPSEMPDAIKNITPKIFNVIYNLVNSTSADSLTAQLSTGKHFVLLTQSKSSGGNSYSFSIPGFTPDDNYDDGTGSFAAFLIDVVNTVTATSYSTGNNWNNQSLIDITLSGYNSFTVKGRYYDSGGISENTLNYTATETEKLYLFIIRGGSQSFNYTVTTTGSSKIISSATGSGGRINAVYEIDLEATDTISVYNASNSNSSCEFLAYLIKVV